MKKIALVFLVLVVSLPQLMAADNYSALWSRGNELYRQKQYDSAAACFEQIAILKPRNAEIYYNLGNTYYRMNRIAMAVLNYERALKIDPEYKEAMENLMLTQSRISNHIQPGNEVFFMKWWEALTLGVKATMWAIWALLIFILMVGSVAFRRFQKADGWLRLPVQVPGILGFVWVCIIVLAVASAQNSQDSTSAVVLQNDAPLMNAEQKGKPLSLLPEGTTVKIIDMKGDFAEVVLPDGRKGWLQQSLLNKF